MLMRFRAKQLIEECENRFSWRSAIGFSVFLASDASSSLRCQRRATGMLYNKERGFRFGWNSNLQASPGNEPFPCSHFSGRSINDGFGADSGPSGGGRGRGAIRALSGRTLTGEWDWTPEPSAPWPNRR